MKNFALLLFFLGLFFNTHYANAFDPEEWVQKNKKLEALEYTQEQWGDLVEKNAEKLKAEELIPIFTAIIAVESSGFEDEESHKKAKGLMGVKDVAAKEVGETTKNLYEPNKNIRVGQKYFLAMLEKFNNDIFLALAAYNAGETKIRRTLQKGGKIPNKKYVLKVLYLAKIANENLSEDLISSIANKKMRNLIAQL